MIQVHGIRAHRQSTQRREGADAQRQRALAEGHYQQPAGSSECWMEDDHLVINNWYRGRSNGESEIGKGLTLKDILQKLKTLRRVKHGDVLREGHAP